MAEGDKAGVIILTGFLGAGKTTLVNRILTGSHGRRVAVIVNDYGQVGIDHQLLISSNQPLVQMNNGCICCTVRGDLLGHFFTLLEHRSDFDTVIIETTGLAEPGPIVQALYADERVRGAFTLQGIVTVVDAKHLSSQLRESGEAVEQIAFADLVLLNKTDLATPVELDALEDGIRQINMAATICRTRNSQANLADILNLEHVGIADGNIDGHDRDHDDHHCHDDPHAKAGHGHHHHHLQGIETISIVEAGALDGLKLGQWFCSLREEFGANILRMKGILDLWGDPDEFIFQGVQTELECRPGRPWHDDKERINRLVFIGRHLDEARIEQGFRACLSTGGPPTGARPDPFRRSNHEISPLTLDQIRFWLRGNFEYAPDVPIVIKEVPCGKPGCPPIETAIIAIVRDEPPRLFKVQRPINEITFDHIYDLMENPMPCC